MITIIDLKNLEYFVNRFNEEDCLIVPIMSDIARHPLNNTPSFFYITFLKSEEVCILPFNHSETSNLPQSILSVQLSNSNTNKFVFNKKELLHIAPTLRGLVDINVLQYIDTGVPIDIQMQETLAHTFIKRLFGNYKNLNRVIPILKHTETLGKFSRDLRNAMSGYESNIGKAAFSFMNDNMIEVFSKIEDSGVFVDTKLAKHVFGSDVARHISKDGLLHTEYNLYTSTGRPSNRFGGINFAALHKEDETRTVFTSRFGKDGMLVLFDYDAFHLRLIANIVGFKFPPGNVHEMLGKIYFDTDVLSEDQYNESKRISFSMLYGGIRDEYKRVPFFSAVASFIVTTWENFRANGYVESAISKRRFYSKNLDATNPQKLFNYIIQLYETEQNVLTLKKLLPLFEGNQSKLSLYTYDSILIDFCVSNGKDFLLLVKECFECEKQYPVKVFVGKNYKDLENVTAKF